MCMPLRFLLQRTGLLPGVAEGGIDLWRRSKAYGTPATSQNSRVTAPAEGSPTGERHFLTVSRLDRDYPARRS